MEQRQQNDFGSIETELLVLVSWYARQKVAVQSSFSWYARTVIIDDQGIPLPNKWELTRQVFNVSP